MASLEPPLTIISDGGGVGGNPFQPPAATWFDEDPLHFVALEARLRARGGGGSVQDGGDSAFRSSVVSGIGSIDTSMLLSGARGIREGSGHGGGDGEEDEDPLSEIVQYQAFGLPKHHHHHGHGQRSREDRRDRRGDGDDPTSDGQPISAFDAAKKAAQDSLKTLTTEISVAFPLPYLLATMEVSSPSMMGDDDTCATDLTIVEVRRIPILAKFSPRMGDMRFLALQYTPAMVRIATVEGEGGSPKKRKGSFNRALPTGGSWDGGDHHSHVASHWTIDLSNHADPVASKPEELPDFQEGSNRNMFGKRIDEEGIVPGSTSIIGGGVLWIARGEDREGDNASLDLVIVATTSVIVYNINAARRQLVKTQVLPHDLAASFWYESTTRTLVVGSYKANESQDPSVVDGSNRRISYSLDDLDRSTRSATFPSAVMAMKTLFFSKNSAAVETLPTFSVGALREVEAREVENERHELLLSLETFDSTKMEKLIKKADAENAVVLPTEIFLVNLYGSVYCVELGSLGSGQGIGLTKLDREAGCIHVRHHNFEALKGYNTIDVESTISVGVIDNLLCIFSKKAETTYFLDVADIFSDDQRVFRECIPRVEPEIHVENLAFLAPRYFLDTSGQGLLYRCRISLPLVLQCVPPTACIVPFLLRRSAPRDAIRGHVMGRFATLIGTRDMASLRLWMGVIVDRYSKSEVALKFDFESTVMLLPKCSLLSLDDIDDADETKVVGQIMVPSSCRKILTQTEMLQMIFLPHALTAIKHGDPKKLRFISSLSVHYFLELERRLITPSAALQCLVVTLLWRTGENAELASFLSALQSQWTITRRRRMMELPTANRMYFDDPGAIPFAETLFNVATEKVVDKASVPCAPSTERELISFATIILLGCGATFLLVKCLLSAGQLNDAINICTKKIRPNKAVLEDKKFAEGTKAKDFFRAAIINAKHKSSVSERCMSFYHLHCFLQQWDPSIFTLDSRKIRVARRRASVEHMRRTSFRASEDFDTVVVEQSVFAHEYPRFPDELFGGKESACCQKLRAMFGYVQSISAATYQSNKKYRRSSFAQSCPNIHD